jgi:hypothetical protein
MNEECSCGENCDTCEECEKPYCECKCDMDEKDDHDEKDW